MPRRLPHHYGERGSSEHRGAPQDAAARRFAALVCVGGAETNAARHGQGREYMRALRPLRGAVSYGSVGHAKIHRADPVCNRRGGAKRQAVAKSAKSRVNDFVLKLANVNGTGSASANSLLMKAIFRMGVPVTGKNFFPSNIQGLPTWYEVRVSKDGYLARSGAVDVMVAMNARTYEQDMREVSAGGTLIYDSTWPRDRLLSRADIRIIGIPLARMCNEHFVKARTRILMKNIVYVGALN